MPNPNPSKTKLQGEFVLKPQDTPRVEAKSNTEVENTEPATKKTEYREKTYSRPHMFSAFSLYPENVSFINQEEDEEIIFLVRRHFITNLGWILAFLLLSALPIVILPYLTLLFPFLNISNLTLVFSLLFYYLILFGYVLINFSLWYFHVGLVTNKRIIDVDISGILYRNVAHTKLELIEDVSYTQIGAIRSIFNYGDVFIQTAGEMKNFEFDKAPQPQNIVHTIGNLIGKRHEHN